MRPPECASRPASTALRIASAIRAGTCARVTALANRTASQPSSIASAASEAVAMPASRTTGTSTASRRIAMLYGLRMPAPLPIGEPRASTAATPAPGGPAGVEEPPTEDRVVGRVREHREAVVDQLFRSVEQLDGVREQRAVVAD